MRDKFRIERFLLLLVLLMATFFVSRKITMDNIDQALAEKKQAAAAGILEEDMNEEQKMAKDAMKASMDALSQLMYDTGLTYDSKDNGFVWAAIYYMINMYPNDTVYGAMGKMEINAEEMTVSVHKDVLLSYGKAMFADLDELPDIPELSQREDGTFIIEKDPEKEDFYKLLITQRGNSVGELRTWCENEDGSIKAQVVLADSMDNCILAYYLYSLIPEKYNAPFPYRVNQQSFARNTYEEEPLIQQQDLGGAESPMLDILDSLSAEDMNEIMTEETEETQ